VGLIQIVLSAGLFFTLPLWKKPAAEIANDAPPMKLKQVLALPGAKSIMLAFFCYCALEQTVCLWSASFLTLRWEMSAEMAAGWASMFYLGITAGRFLSGFVTMKLNDTQMIRLGCGILGIGVIMVLLPLGQWFAVIGLMLVGLGCAPIYPCIIHSTPAHFGVENSQAMVGVQMASAYLGSCLMPPLFGLIAENISIALFPTYLLAIALLMAWMHEVTCKKAAR
jgi:fucose permease